MNNLYTLSLDSIKYILGLIRDTVDLPANILDDLHIQSTTTYSSYRLDTLLKALKEENIQYCDEAISKLNKLSKEIITDKLQITNENTIYLLLTDPVNNVYEQWLLINGTPQMIGTTEMKLDSVYTKNEADDRYALLTDFNTLTTSFNNLVTSVDKKIDKDKIVTVLDDTVTDEQVASAKVSYDRIKGLEDKVKDGKFYIRHTTLDNLLDCYGLTKKDYTIEELFLALPDDGIRFGFAYNNDTAINKITDLPNGSYFFITIEKALINYNIVHAYNISNGNYYMWRYHTNSRLARKWEIMNKTSVEDVPFTTLTVNNWATGNVVYTVENGICYIWISGLASSTMDQNSQTIVSNLPRPKKGGLWSNITSSDCTKGGLLVTVTPDGKLNNYSGLNNVTYFGTFSYPVAE